MLLTQMIRRAAQVNPRAISLIDDDEGLTWPMFVERVSRLADALCRGGLQPGERVALMGLNSRRYMEALYATWWAGGVAVPLNTRWTHEENLFALRDSGAAVLICDDHFVDAAGALAGPDSPVKRCIHYGGAKSRLFEDYEALIAAGRTGPSREAGQTGLAALYYTGGTTGFPKGVMLSPLAMWSSAIGVALDWKLDQDVRYLHAAPMFHLADGCMSLAVTLSAGAHIFLPAFKPEPVLEAIAAHRVTHLLLVPTMIRMLIDSPALAGADLSSLRSIVYGASPIPETTLRDAMAALPRCEFVQAYGQTELAPLATMLAAEHHVLSGPASKLGTAGRAGFCTEVKVADDAGRERPRGEAGEVWVRGPNVMLGYWNRPDQTAATLVDGWVRTGDAATMDEDGFIRICDRLKDMIIAGGENVFSAEVENAIASHPDVAAVAVIGVPDPAFGERVHAVVVPREGAAPTLEAIYAHCHGLIAGYKCPRSLELRHEPLPLSGAGKVLKTELRAPHWTSTGRQVN